MYVCVCKIHIVYSYVCTNFFFLQMQGENILSLDVESHARTTGDYQGPVVAPKIQALLEEALRDEGELEFDAAALNTHYSTKGKVSRKDREKHLKSGKIR